MQLPVIQGTFDQPDFFIYAACDSYYFADFGASFINSIRSNTNYDIHIHLFNPRSEQIDYCQRHGVGATWEHVPNSVFIQSAQRWSSPPTQEPELSRYERTVNAMGKGGDQGIIDRMQKTYYACARFIRLAELYKQHQVFAVDIDAVVRAPTPVPGSQHDFYLHHITGRRARYLAGGLWLTGTVACQQFLIEYAQALRFWFEQDYVYWGLDQDLLDSIVPRYNHGQLPMSYIDWNMRSESPIWTAKGTRKELDIFVNEQQKYKV